MPDNQDSRFQSIAGQLIASGIETNMPIVALEQKQDSTTFKNLEKINGLMPKISDTIISDVKVFNSPVDKMIRTMDQRYGAAVEMATFLEGAVNKKQDGTCVGRGTPTMDAALYMSNFAYSVDVDVKDREIDKAVMNEQQVGSYTAAKLRTPLKTIAGMRYHSWVQILSDVIDGTRTITSTDASDGTGSPVTYEPTVTGYAGKVDYDSNITIAPLQVGTKATVGAADAINILTRLKAVAADFEFETSEYNKLGADTFATGKPWIVFERKVLDACDVAFSEYNLGDATDDYGFAGFPTKSFRDAVGEFADIVEIDSFASLPTNNEYSNARVLCAMLDKDACYEFVKENSVEAQRCSKQRLTGYNFRGESIFAIWRGVNSYALLVKATN